MVTDFACKNSGKLCEFLYNSKYGWCKIRSRHCEKCLFTVEKKTNLLYINFIVVNFPLLRMSCFVNQCKFLGCWLKRDFKLHDTISHVNLDACYSTGKGHCSIMRVFLYNSKYGWCKIRSRHCEKCLFTVEKKTNLLYINFIVVNFPLLRMSCFVNQCKFLGCWLKRDFKLHDTISHVNLDACYSTGKGHCSIVRVFKIHRIACKLHKKNTCETLKRLK